MAIKFLKLSTLDHERSALREAFTAFDPSLEVLFLHDVTAGRPEGVSNDSILRFANSVRMINVQLYTGKQLKGHSGVDMWFTEFGINREMEGLYITTPFPNAHMRKVIASMCKVWILDGGTREEVVELYKGL